jgi:preprotein translocase subunit YajC
MEMIDFLLAMAPPASAAEGAVQEPAWVSFMPFIIIFVMFYFLLIRPQAKRQKEHEAMIKAVKTGDKIIAAGGIYGVVSNVKDTSVIMKIDEGVKIEVQKASIMTVNEKKSEDAAKE